VRRCAQRIAIARAAASAAQSVRAADPPTQPAFPDARLALMLDFLMVAYGVVFFAAAILYVLACEKM
jgi:hypothetical protein